MAQRVSRMYNDIKNHPEIIREILDFISNFESGDFSKRLINSENYGALAPLINQLNATAQTLEISKKDLESKNAIIESIVENIPVAIFLKNAKDNFRVTLWNKAAEEIFELKREEILGKTTHDLWPKEYADLYLADDLRVTKDCVSVDIPEELSSTKTRGEIILHTQKVPMRIGGEKEASYLLGICEDITEQKNSQKTIIHSAKMASLGEMAAGIAHEINNPLAIIRIKSELIVREIDSGNFDPKKIQQDVLKIENTVDRITKIINGLRDFSRNSEKDPTEITKISQILEDTLELCRERFKYHSIALQVKCDEDFYLDCKSSEIIQILMNLLSNAFDAVENLPEKWVTIHAIANAKTAIISVTDSGNGIPGKVAEKMMQPFFTTKNTGKGTGLGLSISQGFAADHQGTLRYMTSAKNTCFVLELPIKQG